MSAGPTTPAPEAAEKPVKKADPASRYGNQSKYNLHNRLRVIPKRDTSQEAVQKKREWVAKGMVPEIFCGEFVLYRKARSTEEFPGIIIGDSNYTWELLAMIPGGGFKKFESVSWYDHTLEDPEHTCDPHAAHNSNGTFRRTEFSELIVEMKAVVAELLQQTRGQVNKIQPSQGKSAKGEQK